VAEIVEARTEDNGAGSEREGLVQPDFSAPEERARILLTVVESNEALDIPPGSRNLCRYTAYV